MSNYATARLNMVEGQLRPNRVLEPRLVEAMKAIPRELFVPMAMRSVAYVDEDVPLGGGRYLTEPLVIGRLLQEAEVNPKDVVLDIGCATGYSTALLSRLASTVVAIDSDGELVARAAELFVELGFDTAVALQSDMTQGYPAQAPYDVILINGSVAAVPDGILAQLGDKGRLLAVVSPDGHFGEARLFRKFGSSVSSRVLFNAATPLLPGFEPKPRFVF